MNKKEYFGENQNIEFKREIPSKHERFLKDIVAFANCSGGKVILGIEDMTNEVYGIGNVNPFRLSDDITNMISGACIPQIITDITPMTIDNKTILIIQVFPGKYRPYYLKKIGKENSTYIRSNGTSRPADKWRIQELELEGQRIYYDMLPEIGMKFDENEANELCKSMYEIALNECHTKEERDEIKEISIINLENMGIIQKVGEEYQATHAYRLLTSNGIRHAKIQCALFKGTSRNVFIDKKEFGGPIYEQVDNAYQFLLRHTNMGAQINGLYRRDVYELPVGAVREAIINAIAHRSYQDDSCVQLSIYDDRIDIYSPGGLYAGLDLEDALKGKSKCRNIAISEAFHYMKLMESWGTGLKRIQDSCKEYGLDDPLIEEDGYGFRVTFYRLLSQIHNEGPKVEEESPKIDNEGPKLEEESPKIDNEGPNKENGNNLIKKEIKVDNVSYYEDILKSANIKEVDIINIITIYNKFNDTPFKRKDLIQDLEWSKSKVSSLLKLMKKYSIIKAIPGKGRGLYCFTHTQGEEHE